MNNMRVTWNGTYNDDKEASKNTKLHGQWALPLIKALSMCNNVLEILDGMDQ